MPTRIVNRHKERFDVYIGRGTPWGNPSIVGQVCARCGELHADGAATLPCYRQWLHEQLQNPVIANKTKALLGRTLACSCKPKPCHGDILVRAVRWLNGYDPSDETI